MTKLNSIISVGIGLLLGLIVSIYVDTVLPGDEAGGSYILFGGLHTFINLVGYITSALLIIVPVGNYLFNEGFSDKYDKDAAFKFNYKSYIKYVILLLFFWGIIYFYKQTKFIYNHSIQYHNIYNQKVQEKLGFYDKMWKTYLQKEKITNLNKETFIQVTTIIMENRKDGSGVAWKWVQENQQIPYSEFTEFYKDLSTFIESQREEYFNIEKECQIIANKNNTLLDTLPNNLYNKIIGCKQINFQYGFLSKQTDSVFKTHHEDIK